jgi:energy-coupling factor transporter transmembrane protein EcfT
MPSGNGKHVDSPPDQSRQGNQSDEPSPQSASSAAQRSRHRRTLLFAGVFALLAMVFVPTPKHGYRLIFDRSDTSIAFFQLLVNVAFAALVGGLVANLPWRRAWFRRGIYLVGACLTIAVGIIAFTQIREDAVARAGSDARYADYLLRTVHDGVRDKDYLLHAADNWHIAGDTVQEQRARQRADNAYQEAAVAREAAAERAAAAEREAEDLRAQAQALEAVKWARIYEDNAEQLLSRLSSPRDLHDARYYLRRSAESWHVVGNAAEEQRVRARLAGLEPQANATESRDAVTKNAGGRIYAVQTGDTLFSISRKFYKSPDRWKEILDANRKDIRNPKKLTVGQTLIIP